MATKPAKITLARVMKAIESDEDVGFCVACGKKAYGVEPDARKYTCESCGEPRVYGAEELLMHLTA
jgi:ribosomal protein L37E